MPAIPKRFVIAKNQHIGLHPRLGTQETLVVGSVLRWGYTDFSVDLTSDEEIIQTEYNLYPDIDTQDWYYYGGSFHTTPEA